MRKAFIILTGILFTLLFATCKQFTADIDDYLSRWSTEAFILSSTIDKKTYNDGSSIPSVASANDVTVTLKVQNHKSFQFIMPSASETRNIVEFAHFAGTKPAVSADYELKQLTADTLQLVYKADFLKNSEWGEKDVSSTITLYADDGRPPFKQTFTVPLKANTPPPLPTFTVAKTTGSPAYYVLCIKVPDMDKTVPGGLLHKDLARIEVNGTPYTFSVNEAQTAFTKPEANVFITHSDVEKLDEPDAAAVPADSSWVLYYKTDVEVKDGAAKKDYTIKLIDEKGLASGIVNASTNPNKAEPENINITKGTPSGGSGSESDPTIIGTDSSGAELTISSPTANTTVHCTVIEIGGSTPVKYDGNPVTVPLPLNGAGEKKYKLEYYTDGEGFAATPVQTVYYKVVKGHTVRFNVVGGNGSLKGQYGSDQQTATTSPVTLTVPHGYSVTFTATPTDATHYKVGDWTCTPSEGFTGASGNPTATLTVTVDTTVSVQFVQLNALTLSTLKIHGQDASAGSVTLSYTITQVKKEDISLAFSGQTGINFTVSPSTLSLTEGESQSITINVAASQGNYPAWSKTVSITRAKNDVAKLRSFTLNGETKTAASDGSFASEYEVASDKAEVKGFSFADGSTGATASVTPAGNVSIPEGTGQHFTITVKAQDDTTKTIEFTVKRKKYKVDYSVETVDGEPGGTIEAGTSGQTTGGTVWVTHGGSVTFKGRPATEDWKVAGWTGATTTPPYTTEATLSDVKEPKTVTVKFYQSTLKNPATWKDLARAVKSAPDNAVITINGEIQATDVTDDKSEIDVKKNLTIKGENNAVLNALGKQGIFDAYKTLTLQDITLKNSKKPSNYSGGAGVYVNSYGTLIMKGSSVITECSAVNWGGGVYVGGGTFEMHDTSAITGCTASKGGGVYVSSGTFKMKGSAIVTPSTSGDTDKPGKNDVYLKDGKTITVDGALSNAHAARITPENYDMGKQVLSGSSELLKSEHGKFAVTPKDLGGGTTQQWQVGSKGELNPETVAISGSASERWKKLKEAAKHIAEGGTIFIDGEIKATIDTDNNGEIVINKNLTIKKKADGASSAVIDANKDTGSKPKHRIFKVESGKTLTLENLTLKGGIAEISDMDGGGGVYVKTSGQLIMTGSSITDCEAIGDTVDNKYGEGGGVYNKGTVKMTGGEIKNNKARNGGGVYNGGVFEMTGGEIKDNKAGTGGGVYFTSSEGGTFKMSGSAVVTPATGSEANSKGKNDVYLESGKKITVDGTLTGTAPVARITPESYMVTQVLQAGSGVTLANEVGKFTVTQPNSSTQWYIDNSGALKPLDTASVANATQLYNAIQSARDGVPLVITITQGFTIDVASLEIKDRKNITIQDNGTSIILDCPNRDHKYFCVENGGKLTLQGKITLRGGGLSVTERHALYVKTGGTAEIKDEVTITNFKGNAWGGCVYIDGTYITGSGSIGGKLTMSGGKITGNSAMRGGGVFIANGGIFEMTGGSIEGNAVTHHEGRAMYISGTFNWTGGTITGHGGAVNEILHKTSDGQINNNTNPHQEPS